MNKKWARGVKPPNHKVKSYGVYKLGSGFFMTYALHERGFSAPKLMAKRYLITPNNPGTVTLSSGSLEVIITHRLALKNILNTSLVHTLKL